MKTYKGIIFDMDGVLFDTENISKQAWIEVASTIGLSNIEEHFGRCLGLNEVDEIAMFYEVYGMSTEDYLHFMSEVSKIKQRYAKMPIKPGVVELLKWLSEHCFEVALASSSPMKRILKNLGDYDLIDYFRVIQSGDSVKHSKPDPEIFNKTADMMTTDKSQLVIIEDSPNGITAGNRAGIDTIMVIDTVKPSPEIQKLLIYTCDNLFQVKQYLGG